MSDDQFNKMVDAVNLFRKILMVKLSSGSLIKCLGVPKEIRSLENRGILLKRTTSKITSQEVGFFNFFRPLITCGISLMKKVLASLAKSVLVSLESMGAALATDAAIKNKFLDPA